MRYRKFESFLKKFFPISLALNHPGINLDLNFFAIPTPTLTFMIMNNPKIKQRFRIDNSDEVKQIIFLGFVFCSSHVYLNLIAVVLVTTKVLRY